MSCAVNAVVLSLADAEVLRGVVGADALPFSPNMFFKLDEIRFETRRRINFVGLGGGDASLIVSPVRALRASDGI
jgi:hypothetical protein